MNDTQQKQRSGAGYPLLHDWEPAAESQPDDRHAKESVRFPLKLARSHFDQRVVVYLDQPLDWT